MIEVDGKIEGFCHAKMIEDKIGCIFGLYLTPDVAGKGFGKKVYDKCFEYLSSFSPDKIVVDGTITARGFYEKMGFKVVKENKSDIRGAIIEGVDMEKILR